MNARYLIPIILCAGGCMVGPKFHKPEVSVPARYIGQSDTASSALNWQELFTDTTLQRLITTAINHNRNVAVAFSNIEQARLTLHATRAGLWPGVSYDLSNSFGNRSDEMVSGKPTQTYTIEPSVSWEIDLFGRIRRSIEADRASLMASDATAQGVLVALVAEVASSYYSFLEYESMEQIARRTARTQQETCDLIRQSFRLGNTDALDLQQATAAVATSNASVAEYQRATAQATHALCVLLGRAPDSIVGVHRTLDQYDMPTEIPAGLPSSLLSRRPDMIEAYYNVMAANARVGVAEAARLPSIALTGAGGTASDQIGKLFSHTTLFWSIGANITGPIFAFGANKRQAEAAREAWRASVLNYEQCYLQALQEVNDALIGTTTYRTQCDQLRQAVDAAASASELALMQYQLGGVSYLNVLDAQRTLFEVQSSQAECLTGLLSQYATLYKVLGGGFVDTSGLLRHESGRVKESHKKGTTPHR